MKINHLHPLCFQYTKDTGTTFYIKKVSSMNPAQLSAQQLNQSGKTARHNGQYTEAILFFTAAIEQIPKDSYFYNRALAQLSQNTNLLQNATYALDDFFAFLALTADAYLQFIQETTNATLQAAAADDMFSQLLIINKCYLLATNAFQLKTADLQRCREDLLADRFSGYAHVQFPADLKQQIHQLQPLFDVIIMVMSDPKWYLSAARTDVRQLFETSYSEKLLQLIQQLNIQLQSEGGVPDDF